LGPLSRCVFWIPALIICGVSGASAQLDSAPLSSSSLDGNPAGIDWVALSSGSFWMGAGEPGESPQRVSVRGFQIARTLVTNTQYSACVQAGACRRPPEWCLPETFKGERQPAVCVDWNDAQAFARWAGGRLPTEAEWEFAARGAGLDRRYPWGNEPPDCARAVISDRAAGGDGCGRKATWPVCSKPAGNSIQGLCDMAGNVWEWIDDAYHLAEGTSPEGPGGASRTVERRVARGGSWIDGGREASVGNRAQDMPGDRIFYLGFRLVKSADASRPGVRPSDPSGPEIPAAPPFAETDRKGEDQTVQEASGPRDGKELPTGRGSFDFQCCRSGFSVPALVKEISRGRDSAGNPVGHGGLRADLRRYYQYKAYANHDPAVCSELEAVTGSPRSEVDLCRDWYNEAVFGAELLTRDPRFVEECAGSLMSPFLGPTREDYLLVCRIIQENAGDPEALCGRLIPRHLSVDYFGSCISKFRQFADIDPHLACRHLKGPEWEWVELCLDVTAFHRAVNAARIDVCAASQTCRVLMGDSTAVLARLALKIRGEACPRGRESR